MVKQAASRLSESSDDNYKEAGVLTQEQKAYCVQVVQIQADGKLE